MLRNVLLKLVRRKRRRRPRGCLPSQVLLLVVFIYVWWLCLTKVLFGQAVCETYTYDPRTGRVYIQRHRPEAPQPGVIAVKRTQAPPPPIPAPLEAEEREPPPSPKPPPRILKRRELQREHFGRRVQFTGFFDREFDDFEGCGPVAVAITLAAADTEIRGGYATLVSELDPEHDGTTTEEVSSYCKSYNFATRVYRDLTPLALQKELDAGRAALVVVQSRNDVSHWAIVTGYLVGQNGRVTHWRLVDNGRIGGNVDVGAAQFDAMWAVEGNRALVVRPPSGQFARSVTIPLRGPSGVDGLFPSSASFISAALLAARGVEVHPTAYRAITDELDPERDGVQREDFIAYLDRHFDVQERAAASTELLRSHLDTGQPVIVTLLDPRENQHHWSLVRGYELDKSGTIRAWRVLDNGWAGGDTIPVAEFHARWQVQSINRYCILLWSAPTKALPRFPVPMPEMRMVNLEQLPERYAFALPPTKRVQYWATRADNLLTSAIAASPETKATSPSAVVSAAKEPTSSAETRRRTASETKLAALPQRKGSARSDPSFESLRHFLEESVRRQQERAAKHEAELVSAKPDAVAPEHHGTENTAKYWLTVIAGIALGVVVIGLVAFSQSQAPSPIVQSPADTPSPTPTCSQSPVDTPKAYLTRSTKGKP